MILKFIGLYDNVDAYEKEVSEMMKKEPAKYSNKTQFNVIDAKLQKL